MKTTTVQASELADSFVPSDHMVRVLLAAEHVQVGDRIRVRQHRKGADSKTRKWHTVLVEAAQSTHTEMIIQVDKWPIAYVCAKAELVELVEIQRTVSFRCVVCVRAQDPPTEHRTVRLKDFVDQELMQAGGLQVAILRHADPDDIVGYCREHGTEFLA